MKLRYASVCSGVEAATLAWHRLGWEPVWFSEIDPFPCAVLKERFPTIPNLGDMTKIKCLDNQKGIFQHGTDRAISTFGRIDLLVGGTPCQSFSQAGTRTGLRGVSGLALTYCDLLAAMRPKWIVWENVPGVFSTNGGEDFRTFVRAIDALGYCCAWRVLDTQHVRTHAYPLAIPQRRRRVFFVGHSGADWRYPAEVLFERESLFGNPPPRRIKGQGFTAGTEASVGDAGKGAVGGTVAGNVAPTITEQQNTSSNSGAKVLSVHGAQFPIISDEVGHPLGAVNRELENTVFSVDSAKSNSMKSENPLFGFHRAEVARTLDTTTPEPTKAQGGQMVVSCAHVLSDQGGDFMQIEKEQVAPTIRSQMKHHEPIVCYPINSMVLGKEAKPGDRQTTGIGGESEPLPTEHHHAVATFARAGFGNFAESEVGATITGDGDSRGNSHLSEVVKTYPETRSSVRRITPTEAERLMGFPDNWTRIPWRGKPEEECPDGPRYKCCGNSMSVNCMEWIGEGIDEVERITNGGNENGADTKNEENEE